MTVTSKSDGFNRADEALNKTGGNWVGDTAYPQVVSNEVLTGATNTGCCMWKEGFPGIQSSEITITDLGTSSATRVAVHAGCPDTTTQPGSYLNWYGTIGAHYRFAARGDGIYRLAKKSATSATYTTLASWTHTPAVGEKLKITYDPATGVVKGYVDTGSGFVERVTYTDASPVPSTQVRIGFSIESGAHADAWAGSWDDGGAPPATWEFFEYYDTGGGVMSERPLTITEYDGAAEDQVDIADTAEQNPASDLPWVQPMWADSVADVVGINVHYNWGSTSVYGNTDAVTQLILDMGARHVRDRLAKASSAQNQAFPDLYAAGVLVHGTVSVIADIPITDAEMDSYLDFVKTHPEYFSGVANVNEPNTENSGTSTDTYTGWATKLRNHQKHLSDRMAALSIPTGPASVARIAPALKDAVSNLSADFTTLAGTDIDQFLDFGDCHRYPQGSGNRPTPVNGFDDRIGWARNAYGTQAMYVTEFGWKTPTSFNVGYNGIPQDVQAAYVVRGYLELLNRGVRRAFYYELLDDPDSTGTVYESHGGLVETPVGSVSTPGNWTEKPALAAIADVFKPLWDQGGGYNAHSNPFVPSPIQIRISVTGTNADLFRYVLAAKRDGTAKMLAWVDAPMWDNSTKQRVAVSPVDVSIERPAGTIGASIGGVVQVIDL